MLIHTATGTDQCIWNMLEKKKKKKKKDDPTKPDKTCPMPLVSACWSSVNEKGKELLKLILNTIPNHFGLILTV